MRGIHYVYPGLGLIRFMTNFNKRHEMSQHYDSSLTSKVTRNRGNNDHKVSLKKQQLQS